MIGVAHPKWDERPLLVVVATRPSDLWAAQCEQAGIPYAIPGLRHCVAALRNVGWWSMTA